MKRFLLPFIILAFSLPIYSQSNSEVSLLYGKSTGRAVYCVLRSGFLDGASYGVLKSNNSYGIRYTASLTKRGNMKIETGVDFLTGKLEINPAPTGDPIHDTPWEEKFRLTSVPIFIDHYFGNYFFINEGIMLDFQKSNSDRYTGFGVGVGFGIGAKYGFNGFTFYLNPMIKRHLFLSEQYGLVELGVKVGVGYTFGNNRRIKPCLCP